MKFPMAPESTKALRDVEKGANSVFGSSCMRTESRKGFVGVEAVSVDTMTLHSIFLSTKGSVHIGASELEVFRRLRQNPLSPL